MGLGVRRVLHPLYCPMYRPCILMMWAENDLSAHADAGSLGEPDSASSLEGYVAPLLLHNGKGSSNEQLRAG